MDGRQRMTEIAEQLCPYIDGQSWEDKALIAYERICLDVAMGHEGHPTSFTGIDREELLELYGEMRRCIVAALQEPSSAMNVLRGMDQALGDILAGTYGGPSLGTNEYRGTFVIYTWGDAPIGMEVLGEGKTVSAAIADYNERKGK